MNYDRIASTYHQRYAVSPMEEVGTALFALANRLAARRILEVGCGTGRWLTELRRPGWQVFGLDASLGMLRQAQQKDISNLSHGDAAHLPFAPSTFEFVYCVNAFHHFGDRLSFLAEARRTLSPGGILATLGMDPHSPGNHMYIYDYFDGVWDTDLRRFAPQETIMEWMAQAGFISIQSQAVKRIFDGYTGEEVWSDPFLEKSSTSQLALLSDEIYQTGLERIRAAISRAAQRGEPIRFETDVTIYMVFGMVAR